MLGALCHYVTHADMRDFQPMKANFGLLPPLDERIRGGKLERGRLHAERALASLDAFVARSAGVRQHVENPARSLYLCLYRSPAGRRRRLVRVCIHSRRRRCTESRFDGHRAFGDVQQQVDFGPAVPGSDAHAAPRSDWMEAELTAAGWKVERQETHLSGTPHYQFDREPFREPAGCLAWGALRLPRLHSDRDPQADLRTQPTPGRQRWRFGRRSSA